MATSLGISLRSVFQMEKDRKQRSVFTLYLHIASELLREAMNEGLPKGGGGADVEILRKPYAVVVDTQMDNIVILAFHLDGDRSAGIPGKCVLHAVGNQFVQEERHRNSLIDGSREGVGFQNQLHTLAVKGIDVAQILHQVGHVASQIHLAKCSALIQVLMDERHGLNLHLGIDKPILRHFVIDS